MSDPAAAQARRSPFAADLMAGTRVLITGGGTGLGRGIAETLVRHGADVHLWGRRDAVLDAAREELDGIVPGHAHVQAVDVRQPDAVDAAMDAIWSEHGPLTGLVNNAAANFLAPTTSLSPRAFEAVTSTVMHGSFFTTQAAGRRWISDGLPGSVVSNLTTWVWTGSAFVVPSAMAKAAVHAMTMSLAVEWAAHGIRLNAVAPGPIPTDFAWQVLDAGPDVVGATDVRGIPAGRHGRVGEIANLVMFLLSDACGFLTGETVAMDGAQRLGGPSTFAQLTALTDADWAALRDRARAASDAARAQRSAAAG